jgi:hypothetical protein
VGDLGFATELGNYGEYSGAPNTAETYAYAKTVLECATSNPDGRGRALLIGGGIANFTGKGCGFLVRQWGREGWGYVGRGRWSGIALLCWGQLQYRHHGQGALCWMESVGDCKVCRVVRVVARYLRPSDVCVVALLGCCCSTTMRCGSCVDAL